MKKIFTALIFMVLSILFVLSSPVSAAYRIETESGAQFTTHRYWEDGENITFFFQGGIMSLPRTQILQIVKTAEEVTEQNNPVALNPAPKDKINIKNINKVSELKDPHQKEDKFAEEKEKYKTIKAQRDAAVDVYWDARLKDEKEKMKAEEKNVQRLTKMMKYLSEQVKEKNGGSLPSWWVW